MHHDELQYVCRYILTKAFIVCEISCSITHHLFSNIVSTYLLKLTCISHIFLKSKLITYTTYVRGVVLMNEPPLTLYTKRQKKYVIQQNTLSEHLISPLVFMKVHVVMSFVFPSCDCLVFLDLSFDCSFCFCLVSTFLTFLNTNTSVVSLWQCCPQ